MEARRRRATKAFIVAYGYIPVTVVPTLLLGRAIGPVIAGLTVPISVSYLGLGVAVAILAVATVQIAWRLLRPDGVVTATQWAAALVGIIGVVATIGAVLDSVK